MNIVNVIFRFFDFFVIVGCGVYVVKHYVISYIEKILKEHSIFIYNLESDCKNLQLTTQSIYENIQDQDRQFQTLQKKFEHWQNVCKQKMALQISEQQSIDVMMHQRFEIQSNFMKNDYMVKKQLPVILDAATKKLQSKYHASAESQIYLDALIDIMKERS